MMNKITFNLPDNLSSIITKKTIDGYIYDTLTSTNDQAWKLSKEKVQSPFFVIAKQQTRGKGQRGNQWKSLLGGLYLSLYLDIDLSTDDVHHLTLVSVCGIVQELQKYHLPVQIKWLNDLILEDQKIGGILCETKIVGNRIKKVVIGVGINYKNSTPLQANSIREFSQKRNCIQIKNIEELASIVINGIFNEYNNYYKLGINLIIKNYNKSLHNLNTKVYIEGNKGIILGINNQGKLKIKISSLTASSNIYLAPENYQISYQKQKDDCYLLTEK